MVPCITRRILLARFLPSAYRTRPTRFRSKPFDSSPYQKFLFGDYSVSHHFLFVKRFLFVFVTFFVFLFSLHFFVITASLLFFCLGLFYSFSFYFCFDHFRLSTLLHPLCDFSHYLSVFLFLRFGYNKDQKLPKGRRKT